MQTDKWTLSQLDQLSGGRDLCWALADAATVPELDRVQQAARHVAISHPHRDQLDTFYRARHAELSAAD